MIWYELARKLDAATIKQYNQQAIKYCDEHLCGKKKSTFTPLSLRVQTTEMKN
jgi:hypothetical protein